MSKGYNGKYHYDPIEERKKLQTSFFRRLFITRPSGGKDVKFDIPYGHYMFCGGQRKGKTVSMVWYADFLRRKYSKPSMFGRRKAKKIVFYSNFGLGQHFEKANLFQLIDSFERSEDEIRIIMVDEIHTYFPKDTYNKVTREMRDDMIQVFSQLGKRNVFLLSTAQVYGRLDKGLREQCLYMISNRKSKISNRIVSEFILGEDILCDELGRWSGIPKKIYTHGVVERPDLLFDTHRLIRS